MDTLQWSKSVNNSAAYHRAGGRRRYNKERQAAAFFRRLIVLRRYKYEHQTPAEIAKEFGVHISTIYRDLHFWFGSINTLKRRRRESFARTLAKVQSQGWL